MLTGLFYLISFCVIGELCLSPTGNSAAVKLAPKAFNSQMMSLWLLTNATAQAINGTLVKLIEPLGYKNYFFILRSYFHYHQPYCFSLCA